MGLGGSGVGIDIGARSIKVVELRVSEKGAVIRRAILIDAAMLKERGVDPANRPQVAALLKKLMVEAGISTRDVVLGISGKDCIIRYTHVPPVPAWRLKIIMDYEVGEVADKIGEKLTSDFRVLPVTREADDDQLVVIALAKESVLEGALTDLSAAGISVAKAVPSAVALYAASAAFGKKPDPENPEDELEVVIDIGAENLNLVFLLNGNLAFVRSASFGGKNFTDAMARDLGLSLEKSEALKLREGTVEQGGRREEVSNTLRGAAVQLLSMIQTSLKFAKGQTGVNLPEPTRFVLLGGGAQLAGLVSYLQAGLRKPVEIFHPAAVPSPEISGEAARALSTVPGNFAVALGLAASSVRRGGLELSLLPSKYVERRSFRERTLFMYLAAGFLVMFLILNLVRGLSENSAVTKRRADLDGWKRFFDQAKTQMLESAAENLKTRARINRVLREAELTPFESFVIDVLSKRAGSELKILGLKLVIDAPDGTDPEYQVHIDGAADNASQKALERIKELRSAFTGEARVARVEVPSTTPDGNWYRFQMVLTPSYPAHREGTIDMEILQRIWQENKKFLLRVGGGLAVFLILNSCIIPAVVSDAANKRSQNQKIEADVVRTRNEVLQRAPEEKRNLDELKQIEKELTGRFLTAPAAEVPDPRRGAPQIQFSERIDRIWGDLRVKANQKNVKIPEKITPADLWVGVGASEEELERSASYLEILGRAMKDCVELGMVQIDKPSLAGEEGAGVRENGEAVTMVYRRVGLTVHGPYEAFKKVLAEYQKPGNFTQMRLLNLDAKGFGGAGVLRGQLEFVGVSLVTEGEAAAKTEKPPEKKGAPSRRKKT